MTTKSKLIAVVSYLSIFFLLPLKLVKNDEFVHYHAKQGAALFVTAIILTFTFWVPILAWICWLAFAVIWVTGIINVISGKEEPLPVIGLIGERVPF